jgi:hypothetical protein
MEQHCSLLSHVQNEFAAHSDSSIPTAWPSSQSYNVTRSIISHVLLGSLTHVPVHMKQPFGKTQKEMPTEPAAVSSRSISRVKMELVSQVSDNISVSNIQGWCGECRSRTFHLHSKSQYLVAVVWRPFMRQTSRKHSTTYNCRESRTFHTREVSFHPDK